MRLETVLKSEEAKDILGEVLEPSGVDAGAGILDILSSASSSLETGNIFCLLNIYSYLLFLKYSCKMI